jgi:hypothetical protein
MLYYALLSLGRKGKRRALFLLLLFSPSLSLFAFFHTLSLSLFRRQESERSAGLQVADKIPQHYYWLPARAAKLVRLFNF